MSSLKLDRGNTIKEKTTKNSSVLQIKKKIQLHLEICRQYTKYKLIQNTVEIYKTKLWNVSSDQTQKT